MDTSVWGNYFSKTEADEHSDNEPNFQARCINGRSDTLERQQHGHPGGIIYNNNRSQECHGDHDRYSLEDFNMIDMPSRNIRFRDMVPQNKHRDLLPRDDPLFYKGDDPYRYSYRSGPGFASPPVRERPDRNNCEIIVISRVLIEYAECIKKWLESIGLVVGLLFPNENIPLGRVLADISSRGCLYAIFILPQNELHCSLTLSILHGIPQEHQNIPVDDAIVLIIRDFDAYMRREKSTSTAGAGAALLTDRHPKPIQMLLNLLVENCQIAAFQYDRLMKYLEERRELRSQYEITEGGSESIVKLESNSKQAELQNHIVSGEPVCQMAGDPGMIPLAGKMPTQVPVQYDRLIKYLEDRRELRGQYEITEGGGESIVELEPNSHIVSGEPVCQMASDPGIIPLAGKMPTQIPVQYDRLMQYLEERRELRSQYEITEGGGESIVKLEPNSKQAELQSCIVSDELVCQVASDPGIIPLAGKMPTQIPVQYDRLMKYLEEHRELRSQYEITEGGGESIVKLEPNSKQAELQSCIVSDEPVCQMASDPGIIPLAGKMPTQIPVQYDRLMKYLEECRELRSQYEITEGGGESIVELEPNSKQAELQSCIVSGEPVCQMASDPGIIPLAGKIPPQIPDPVDITDVAATMDVVQPSTKKGKKKRKKKPRIRLYFANGSFIRMRIDKLGITQQKAATTVKDGKIQKPN